MYIKYAMYSQNPTSCLREYDIILPTSLLHTLFYFTSIFYDRAKDQGAAVIDPNIIPQLNH